MSDYTNIRIIKYGRFILWMAMFQLIWFLIFLLFSLLFLIAAVIFIASVMVPLGKMLVMFYLCWSVSHGPPVSHRQRTVMYRITEFIGKWSMLDVFVVAILVALIHLGGLLVIRPGGAALAFAGVVMVTMVAAESFDPRLIWDRTESGDE